MIPQFDNRLVSSFLLFLDHEIQARGVAYTNYSSKLFSARSYRSGLYAYSTPFKQLCNDTSIAGATIMTGVYLNGSFVTIGQSGLVAINHNEGTAYFNVSLPPATVVSGNYAVKDINVEITDANESKLLFETKYSLRSKFSQILSGAANDAKTIPILFLKIKDTDAIPAAFGGIKDNRMMIRGTLLAENEYQRAAVTNILKNLVYTGFHTLASTTFNYMGDFTGVNYNYPASNFNTGQNPLVLAVKANDITFRLADDFQNLGGSNCTIDFSLSTFFLPS